MSKRVRAGPYEEVREDRRRDGTRGAIGSRLRERNGHPGGGFSALAHFVESMSASVRTGAGREAIGSEPRRRLDREGRLAKEYRRCNPRLESYLAAEFPTLSEADREEVRDRTWEDLWRHRARYGDENAYKHPTRYLLIIGRKRALERRRAIDAHPSQPLDPDERVPSNGDGAEKAVVEAVSARLDEKRLRSVLRGLGREERLVLACEVLFDMTPQTTREMLGMTRKRYELVHARALDQACAAYAKLGGEAFERQRARLVAALQHGEVKPHQLLRARKLAELGDRELATALSGFGKFAGALAALVSPHELERSLGAGEGAIAHLGAAWHAARETAGSLLSRGEEVRDQAAQLATSGVGRGAGAGGAGLLAKLVGPGGATKIVGACLAGGAAGCVAGGVIPGVGLSDLGSRASQSAPEHARSTTRASATTKPPDLRVPSARTVTATATTAPKPDATRSSATTATATTTASATTPLAPSTPPVQQQFGVGAATPGSEASPSTPSSSSTTASGGSPVQQEFGP